MILEIMPTAVRESHRAAGNAGIYPHNGAVRLLADRADAEAVVETDGEWSRIVRDARPGDAADFDRYEAGAEF